MDRLIHLHSACIVEIDDNKQLKSLCQTIKDKLDIDSYHITVGLIVPFQSNFLSPVEDAQRKKVEKLLEKWLCRQFNNSK